MSLLRKTSTMAIVLAIFMAASPEIGATTDRKKAVTVPASAFNRLHRIETRLSGERFEPVRGSVFLKEYAKLRSRVAILRRNCRKYPKRVRATWYTDSTGYRGDNLAANPLNYAELSSSPGARDFSALGGLPYRTALYFHHRGRTVRGVKLDVGAGGPRYPKVDLWRGPGGLANRLGFSDGYVLITRRPCIGAWR